MSRLVHKDYRKLARELQDAGCELVQGGKHVKVRRNGVCVGTLPVSSSDHRALRNNYAQYRALGILR